MGEFYKVLCNFNINFQKIFKVLVEYIFAECHRFEPIFLRPYWKFCLTFPPPTKILARPLQIIKIKALCHGLMAKTRCPLALGGLYFLDTQCASFGNA